MATDLSADRRERMLDRHRYLSDAPLASCEILLLPSIPSGSPSVYYWPDGDFEGWLTIAKTLRVAIVYATEVTAIEHANVLRERLDELRTAALDHSFDAEAAQLDLELADITDRTGDEVIGWFGQWRHNGVAHHFTAVQVPDDMRAIDARLDEVDEIQPSQSEQRALRLADFDERRAAVAKARQEKLDIAASALAMDEGFPGCTNLAQRKILLAKLERELALEMEGVNREEVIAAA